MRKYGFKVSKRLWKSCMNQDERKLGKTLLFKKNFLVASRFVKNAQLQKKMKNRTMIYGHLCCYCYTVI